MMPFTFTDMVDDANALNNQGNVLPVNPEQASAIDMKGADIVSVTYTRLDDRRRVLGMRLSLTLSAPPLPGVLYRVMTTTRNCPILWFESSAAVGATPTWVLRHNCGLRDLGVSVSGGLTTKAIDGAMKGQTLTWDLTRTAMPAGLAVGAQLNESRAETRLVARAADTTVVTAPVMDQTAVQDMGYRIGQ